MMPTSPMILPTLRPDAELDRRGGRTVAGDRDSTSHLSIGDRPTVVIVQGGLARGAHAAHCARALADSYRVVVMDRRNAEIRGRADQVGVDVETDDVRGFVPS